ncbi:hypothetical protein CANINC_000171 [Pichia inconspicua]|uniref:Uncharacterized protein n=1 Tax=Pichia inconspicua TaxID=52247 RepID=A0A4T0X6U3_9ASCO|nr:hypothetical protein CANINC_000171 [[Candida] inconspicua]
MMIQLLRPVALMTARRSGIGIHRLPISVITNSRSFILPSHLIRTFSVERNKNHSKPTLIPTIQAHRKFHTSPFSHAEFWKVGQNIKIFRGMLKESGSSQWKYRLVLFLVLFTILNFLFNVMLTILTNIYLERIQPSCSSFGFNANTEFKTGLVDEHIKYDESAANIHYLNTLKRLAKDHDIISSIDDKIENIDQLLLNIKDLEKYYSKKNNEYISVYCDLLLRYALTSEETNHKEVAHVIQHAFDIINYYEKLSNSSLSSYSLKNKALRIQADMLLSQGRPFQEVEKKYYDAIRLVTEHEYRHKHDNTDDIAIVPADEFSSNTLTNSLLDLCSFYSQSKQEKYIKKSLTILLAELRSLEQEFSILDSQFNSTAIFNKQRKNLSNQSEKRLMELRFEKIPLINLQISEILWFEKKYDKALEFAKESAHVASMYAKFNFNSAKIAKMGFANLATMFTQIGDPETAILCDKRAHEIPVPMEAFARIPGTVRDTVLEYWFGSWGKFLFPG